jgi:hypothetical protein
MARDCTVRAPRPRLLALRRVEAVLVLGAPGCRSRSRRRSPKPGYLVGGSRRAPVRRSTRPGKRHASGGGGNLATNEHQMMRGLSSPGLAARRSPTLNGRELCRPRPRRPADQPVMAQLPVAADSPESSWSPGSRRRRVASGSPARSGTASELRRVSSLERDEQHEGFAAQEASGPGAPPMR